MTGSKIKARVEFKDSEFVPKGAVAFFVAVIVFFAVAWFSIYLLMIARHG